MGRYYALAEGLDAEVADAIAIITSRKVRPTRAKLRRCAKPSRLPTSSTRSSASG